MQDADKHKWAVDKQVVPFTSIILQDVYYIKTHSKDFTDEGGINLKVRHLIIQLNETSFFV